ncbi:MAG: hypothetical protein V7609_544 [Verrucomicrobiota bacterium]
MPPLQFFGCSVFRCVLTLAALLFAEFSLLDAQPTPTVSPPPAPEPQPWLQPWREATVALGTIKEAEVATQGKTEKKKIFVPVGTGVIMFGGQSAAEIPFLVTAKHVFEDSSKNWNPVSLQVRFSWFESRPVDDYLGVEVKLETPKSRVWIAHPNAAVDLACVPVSFSPSQLGRKGVAIGTQDFATEQDFFEGAAVAVLGYPGAVGSAYWTKAVLRNGIIAWMAPTEGPRHPFMVDSNVFPGNSGGPVFRLPTGTDRFGSFGIGGRISFLGIVTSGPIQYFPAIADGKEITVPGPQPAMVVSPNLMGLAIVEPASHVRELLDYAAKIKAPSK